LLLWFTDLPTPELYHATLGCLQLGTYQQLNLSCANDSLIYVTDVRHGHSNQSQVACKPEMTSSLTDDGWCLDGPPYNEMVLIQCNSRASCMVDTAEMSSAMYKCRDQVTDTIRATYRCLPGTTVKFSDAAICRKYRYVFSVSLYRIVSYRPPQYRFFRYIITPNLCSWWSILYF